MQCKLACLNIEPILNEKSAKAVLLQYVNTLMKTTL
jgi:hypothetical protein